MLIRCPYCGKQYDREIHDRCPFCQDTGGC
jgi:endogenous inhibitor of DNA gyrase (YacG/DUF329 family)